VAIRSHQVIRGGRGGHPDRIAQDNRRNCVQGERKFLTEMDGEHQARISQKIDEGSRHSVPRGNWSPKAANGRKHLGPWPTG